MTDQAPDGDTSRKRWGDLASGVQAGDVDSEQELARLFYPAVMTMTVGRLRDPETAREVTQDVLLSVITALRKGQVREPEKLPAFVLGTARNLINHHRQDMSRHPIPLSWDPGRGSSEILAGPGSPQEIEVEEDERRELARRALQKLKPLDRQIIVLTLAEGLKPQEIALQVGLKAENVRNRKSRALKAIQRRMARLIRNNRSDHI